MQVERYNVKGFPQRLKMHRILLEELPSDLVECDSSTVRVVLGVHTHAPIAAFYERLAAPKVCVSLPCCADFGLLPQVCFWDDERRKGGR